MGAILQTPTQAEQDLLASFSAGRTERERKAAFERFANAGLPSRRVESWHYTDLRAKLRTAPPRAQKPGAAALARAKEKLGTVDRFRIVTVDGFFSRELSDELSAVPGVRLRPLLEDDIRLKRLVQGAGDALLDLNGAFAEGGFVLEIAPGGRVDAGFELVALDGATGALGRFGRGMVIVGEDSRAALLETRGESREGFNDSALFLSLGRGAQLDYACRNFDSAGGALAGGAAVEVQTIVARLEQDARLRATALVAGAPFLRRQLFVSCAGERAEAHLSGGVLLRGREHVDTTLTLTHDAPSCISRETFKYVLADQAEGVFQGKIVVPPHAQKTDGKMLCRGLLLSDEASMSSKPELEIFADDVVCGHGAACARLDESQLFYMESRGIPRAEAQGILVEAFAAEAFDIIDDEELRDLLRLDLKRLLAGGAFS
ncbi:SufD family Fe-S cluster assembly protein [Rhodoblastus sp.]|uniref:SufB/SufD family protein n=1 Tax=Rhodoblastus sp. TaxID=1962975 RepID=UPI003F977705